jgi:hypothetical protein
MRLLVSMTSKLRPALYIDSASSTHVPIAQPSCEMCNTIEFIEEKKDGMHA